jgi:predicted nuclease with TOPRIM domain
VSATESLKDANKRLAFHNGALQREIAVLTAERNEWVKKWHETAEEKATLKAEVERLQGEREKVIRQAQQNDKLLFENAKLAGKLMQYEEPERFEVYKKDVDRLVRETDVLLNGEYGAAEQASLCDLVAQIMSLKEANLIKPYPKTLLGVVNQFKDVDGEWRDCTSYALSLYAGSAIATRKLFIYTEEQETLEPKE